MTAWDACRRLAVLPHLVFLDSARESALGRYSYVAADPFAWIWPPSGLVNNVPIVLPPASPFDYLADGLERFQAATLPGLPPFQGGAAGLFAYDLCHYLERLPRPRYYDFAVPDLAVGLYDWVVSFDLRENRAWLISTGFPEIDPRRRRLRANERRDQVRRLLDSEQSTVVAGAEVLRSPGTTANTSAPTSDLTGASEYLSPGHVRGQVLGHVKIGAPNFPVPGHAVLRSNFDRAGYIEAVRRAIDYIHAGDCFQVNIAQRLLYPAREPALAVYERLRQCNPAPFAGYFDLGDYAIASASPERFLKVQDGAVETRPIKGTSPRGVFPEEDLARAEQLVSSAKDRAENVMIVDLLRNDLGRVCEYGSVRVEALCRLESFRHVHHLVSEVRGRLRPGLGPIDLLRAAFPGGSVTGAPKIRAMEIIAELEQTARGAYCGSLGFVGFDGTMDTSLLIRTFT
ncbi:MAG TPA: anthranilate synthase component I family protein, partial [Gemmataceae bacterium]|nr:anthranilate synthase component I family protein [Gemmataceae bacterium]